MLAGTIGGFIRFLARRERNRQDSLADVAASWTWRWEMQDELIDITINIGTKERPEWVTFR